MFYFTECKLTIYFNVFIFSACANEYLGQWSEQFEQIRSFSWVSLRTCLNWPQIKTTMQDISNASSFDLRQNSSKVFEQYGYIKIYCSEEKIAEWNHKKKISEDRWVEVFQHMQSQQVPFTEFSQIVEFILCLPGTSASVERVFSSIKNTWKTESSQLKMETLESILFVKNNMDLSCMDFYHFLKTQPQLLRQIGSQEKYNLKVSNASELSAMSIGSESTVDDEN